MTLPAMTLSDNPRPGRNPPVPIKAKPWLADRSPTIALATASAPTVAIDASAYPFIFDIIFAHASYEALLVLRTACREWRERVDAILVRHVVVVEQQLYPDKVPRREWTLRRRNRRYRLTTGEGYPIPRTDWFNTPLVRSIERLDLWSGDEAGGGPAWFQHMRSIRILFDMTPVGTEWLFPAADVHIVGETCSPDHRSPEVRDGFKHDGAPVVIHVPDLLAPRFGRFPSSREGPPRSFTVVFREPSPEALENPNGRHVKYMNRLVQVLAQLIAEYLSGDRAVRRERTEEPPVAITLVNLDAWRKLTPDLAPLPPLPERNFAWVKARLMAKGLPMSRGREWMEVFTERVEAIRLIALDEFKAEVGEEVFGAVMQADGIENPAEHDEQGVWKRWHSGVWNRRL